MLLAVVSFTTTLFATGTSELATDEKYLALPLGKTGGPTPNILNRNGVPFIEGTLPLDANGSARVLVGGRVKRIFLLGMTESAKIAGWADPRDYSVRYFVGDELGQIQLVYMDGTKQVFPLVLGQSIWWAAPFNRFPEQLPSDARLCKAFAAAMRLYPPAPVEDGGYIAVISPKPVSLRCITIESSSAKRGRPIIAGITFEPAGTNRIAGTTALAPGAFSPAFAKFVEEKPLRPVGKNEKQTRQELKNLELAFYSSDGSFKGQVSLKMPQGYSGPEVSFKGNLTAEILANAFYYNVEDILDKIDEDGMYHTSTKGAVWWNDGGLGSTNTGKYYGQSWSRDLGRSLQELAELGYTNDALRCADYCLRMARLWEERPSLKVRGEFLPPHWGRVINMPDKRIAYENDGHSLIAMFLFKLWQRLPNRDEWLRSHWPDVKAAGDWILWQFEHPKISGAANGVLRDTGESSGGRGFSVYPDCICMDALRALAQMADSIGETNSAAQWDARADEMQAAIGRQYIINDPKYGRVWTLEHAGWPYQTTVLGPLVFSADDDGFAPQDEDDHWRTVNEAAYQRLIDTWRPFGFYGLTMGYGQGFVTESALLLDRMRDATEMLNWAAKEIYDPRFGCFIVSEGVQMDPTGRFWYRFGDLGNGVQEAEIVKTLRLVIGVDDTHPDRLQFYPRLPYDWDEIAVEKYPVLFEDAGKMETALLHYKLERSGNGMKLEIGADKELGPVAMRLGPFENQPELSRVRVNGQSPTGASIEHSGDSSWVSFTMPIGPSEKPQPRRAGASASERPATPSPAPEPAVAFNLRADQPGALTFFGSPDADLFSKEINASFDGALERDFVSDPNGKFPLGFLNASPVSQPWYGTMWTRDAGTFMRELVFWGYYEHACQVAQCNLDLVGANRDGFVAFPRYFDPTNGPGQSGSEMDGQAATIIGMVALWQRLPPDDPFRNRLYEFLHQKSSPVRGIDYLLKRQPLIPGSGEFGGGSGNKPYDNVVQNNMCALAFLSAANMEEEAGDHAAAGLWRKDAKILFRNIEKYLINRDGSWIWCIDPQTLKPDPAVINSVGNAGSGSLNGVTSMSADVLGFNPADWPWQPALVDGEKTFDALYRFPLRKEQFEKYGIWPQMNYLHDGLLASPSYGQGYALQDMLLFDRLAMAGHGLDFLAQETYKSPGIIWSLGNWHYTRLSPYYFYERMYSPDAAGRMELTAGCGPLNLVNVSEPLKVARLILGVDDTSLDHVRIIPRVPPFWGGYHAENWPIRTSRGMVRTDISFERAGGSIHFDLRVTKGGSIPKLTVRLPDGNKMIWKSRNHVEEFSYESAAQ